VYFAALGQVLVESNATPMHNGGWFMLAASRLTRQTTGLQDNVVFVDQFARSNGQSGGYPASHVLRATIFLKYESHEYTEVHICQATRLALGPRDWIASWIGSHVVLIGMTKMWSQSRAWVTGTEAEIRN